MEVKPKRNPKSSWASGDSEPESPELDYSLRAKRKKTFPKDLLKTNKAGTAAILTAGRKSSRRPKKKKRSEDDWWYYDDDMKKNDIGDDWLDLDELPRRRGRKPNKDPSFTIPKLEKLYNDVESNLIDPKSPSGNDGLMEDVTLNNEFIRKIKSFSNMHEEKEDHYAVFGKYIGNELRRIKNHYSVQVAKFKICNVLFEVTTGQYSQDNQNIQLSTEDDATVMLQQFPEDSKPTVTVHKLPEDDESLVTLHQLSQENESTVLLQQSTIPKSELIQQNMPENEQTVILQQSLPENEPSVLLRQGMSENEPTVLLRQTMPETESTVLLHQSLPENEPSVLLRQGMSENDPTVLLRQTMPENDSTVLLHHQSIVENQPTAVLLQDSTLNIKPTVLNAQKLQHQHQHQQQQQHESPTTTTMIDNNSESITLPPGCHYIITSNTNR